MKEEDKTDLPSLVVAPAKAERRDGLRAPVRWLAVPLALALLGVLGLGGLVWQGDRRLDAARAEMARRLADSDAQQRAAQAQARQDRAALDALQGRVGAIEAQLAEMQGQQIALQSMYQELSRGGDDRLLVEIEHEVSIAAQQLQLAGNVAVALLALQSAETRLARSAQPQFLPLRKLIARDIERLKALPGADVPGIALRLDALLDGVARLPLAFEQRPASEPAPAAADPARAEGAFARVAGAWFAEVWHELRQLVRIERIDRPDPGLLAPRETFFLRENLRLRLLAARLALLARDGRSFRSDLEQADAWLGQYFDTRAPAVQEAQETLRALRRLDVMHAPADLNETLSALRNFKLAREKR